MKVYLFLHTDVQVVVPRNQAFVPDMDLGKEQSNNLRKLIKASLIVIVTKKYVAKIEIMIISTSQSLR